MARFNRRVNRDANHAARVDDFKGMGCTVVDTALPPEPGFPDIIVGCIGVNHLVEIKNPDTAYGRAGLNANQLSFASLWWGGQVFSVMTQEDVVALVAGWRSHTR